MFKRFFVLFLSCFLLNQAYSVDNSIFEPYLLPKNHVLYKKLDKYFKNPSMFDSSLDLQQKGFKVINTQMPWSIMVFKNKAVGPSYLLKKYSNKKSIASQNENYIRRIVGANTVREYAKNKNFYLITAPKKWLYPLPAEFADPVTNEPGFVLVVEKIPLVSKKRNRRFYKTMKGDHLDQLCITMHDLGGCDAMVFNQPLTKKGQIVFIDTDHLGRTTGDFLGRVVPWYFSPSKQNYVLELWNSL